ncbi:MAG: ABC transporter permease [Thermincola sp.]|jgi:putative ABC transport system permease protein|nr:ABC transporter permease [Thermincola sp.]MDT3702365.1 ABC transporter permease [Thermincola sp.]
MNLLQVVKLAIAGIRANKMRSILTMLGVIIGVAAVIVLVSIGQGATKSVTEGIQGLGSNLITISIRSSQTAANISYEEVMAWQDREGVAGVSPVVMGNVSLKYGNKKYDTSLEGTNAEYQQVRNTNVQAGRFILPIDLTFGQKVALLGTTVVDELFGSVDPIGQTIRINGINFKVVGILEEKGAASFGSNDDRVIIPFTTAQRLTGARGIQSVYVQADSPDSVNSVVNQLDNYLYRKSNQDTDAYRVNNQAEMLSTVNEITGVLTLMLGGIAGISLVVGGIGIMNIMLVTVTERTREIGVRKAIGAKRGDILRQFLIEAIVVSGAGGIIGILCGLLLSAVVGSLMSINTAVSPQIVGLSFGFSVLVGIIFGLYPANKAAKLNPIEALRFE